MTMISEVAIRQAEPLSRQPYEIFIKPGEAGGELCYVASNPELPGCMAQGDTPRQAVESLEEARTLYIACLIEDGLPVPEPNFKIHAAAA